ncbi:hypothetical protein [Zymomonas mobilis]|uniref:hypothetical protein n=1 Tax=Zymomonas mobilis TaxID=542 RepID=UPI000B3663D5|nr:hypothetical protein [Zymomonas mobilis]
MKFFFIAFAVIITFNSVSTFAAPVSASFQNLGKTDIDVSQVKNCGVLSQTPTLIKSGATSPVFTTDCGGSMSSFAVSYSAGLKKCNFQISVIYHMPTLFGGSGSWLPTVAANGSGGAKCRVESQAFSGIESGAFKAVFSMK